MQASRTVVPAFALVAVTAQIASAQGRFDGIYKQPNAPDCIQTEGVDKPIRVEDNILFGVESKCSMTNPVDVRDMDAVLYDMECSGEGTFWIERALFQRAADQGLILVWNGYAFKYDRCIAEEMVPALSTVGPSTPKADIPASPIPEVAPAPISKTD